MIKTEDNNQYEDIKIKPRKLKTKILFNRSKIDITNENPNIESKDNNKQTEKKENHTNTATNPKEKEQDKKPEAKATETHQNVVVVPDTVENRKKILKGYKVNGYRVQVFAGGNSRNDRIKAERIGSEIKSFFPSVPVYVHFYSPRWICRMGNYRTYEEAHEVLTRVKNLGYQSAIIVKGKITVSYQSASADTTP